MSYDDMKSHDGKSYSGMKVGGRHSWVYPDGRWEETKTAPDRWEFTFNSIKNRANAAPVGSGVGPGSEYHWYILASQKVKKVDANAYETFMHGLKFKVGHKRPYWRSFSYEYPEQISERHRIMQILSDALLQMGRGY